MSKAMLRVAEVALLLGVSRSRVYQLCAEGALPFVRHGRAIRFPLVAWERWLAEKADEAMATARRDAPRTEGAAIKA